jgi:hypothetical protein
MKESSKAMYLNRAEPVEESISSIDIQNPFTTPKDSTDPNFSFLC